MKEGSFCIQIVFWNSIILLHQKNSVSQYFQIMVVAIVVAFNSRFLVFHFLCRVKQQKHNLVQTHSILSHDTRFNKYRGQVLTPTSLKTNEIVELISEGVKYILVVTKTSESGYYIKCNDWNMEVDVFRYCHRLFFQIPLS